jgi:membrane protein EpsK
MTATTQSGATRTHHRANLATTIASFAVSLVVGLWFTPYLVHHLGPAAYGLIPLATTIVSYFSLLSQTLGAALSRNLALALGQDDRAHANRLFGVVLAACAILCGILVIPLGAVAVLSPHMFDVPQGMQTQTQILFGIVSATFLLSLFTTCFSSVSFIRNQIYLNNIASLAQTLFRVVATVALFEFLSPSVLYAALAILVSALIYAGLNIVFAKVSVPWLKLAAVAYDGKAFRGFYRTSAHQLVMQLGTVVVMSCEIVLVNRLFGHYDAGRYAAVIQWMFLLRNVSTGLVVLFVPTMLAHYASNHIDELVTYARRAMRWTGLCLALPTGYLCGLSPHILGVWLGHEFQGLWPIMAVQLAPLALVSSVLPLYTVSLAADRVLLSGIVQLLTGVAGIVVSVLVVTQLHAPMVAVALCVGGLLFAKELIFMPLYTANNINRPTATFYPPLVRVAFMFAVAAVAAWAGGRLFSPTSYPSLFFIGVGVSLIYVLVGLVTLNPEDRAILLKSLPLARLGVALS